MENNETKKSKRVYKLKFDQLWVDAINQIPVYYHSEIYYWIDYYQNHNHSDLIGTIKDDLVRSLFMIIYPTIRRRRIAREHQRRYRARKKAERLAAMERQAAADKVEKTPRAVQNPRAGQSGATTTNRPAAAVKGGASGAYSSIVDKKTPHGSHEAYRVGRSGNEDHFNRHEWKGS